MKTSKKLLSVLLTIIMMFSIVFGGLTTAFAVTSGDPATTTITASPTSIVADGSSTSTITVQVNDGSGDPVTTGGDTVTLSVYDGTSQTPLTVTDDTYGTYTATYTSSTTEGTATISGTLNGTAITSTATINQDTTAPAAPVVNNAGYINSTNQAAYAITGTGEVGATVNVTVIDSVTAAVYAPSVTVDTYGGFIATVDTSTLAEGTISITATQTDAAGNVSSEATVGVTKDTTVPVIAMLGITPMNVAIGAAYTDAGATASDNLDGNITASIITSGTVDTNTVGSYTITYNVNDIAGNTATEVTRTVVVASPVTLSSIAITAPATKLIYTVGDTLDIFGMEVTGTYSDDSTAVETIISTDVAGFDSSAPAVDQLLTITVGDKTTTYTVTINAALSSANAITAFDFATPAVTGTVDEAAKTVDLTVPFGTDVATLVPTIVHTGSSVSPDTGMAQDFTSPVTYTVTAADASTQSYTVTVTVATPTVASITGNNILLIGDYAFDLSDPANNKYDLNNFLVAANTAYLNAGTYEVYFRIGDAWYDIISDPDMLNQITDLTTINGDGLFNYMNMQ